MAFLRSAALRAALVLLAVPAGAAEPPSEPANTVRIPRVKRPPKLSDFLNNVPREAEAVVTDFRQFMPGDGVPASQPTTAFLSYDDKNLYVAWICKDDPKLIRGRVAKREQVFSDDRFNLCIDTFHDRRHMYWFDINPYGIQADGNVTDGVEDDPSWDTLWHAESKITADGYVGLAAIPFKSIRFPAAKEQTWGVILARWIMRYNEFSLWPAVSRTKPGFSRQAGDLTGLQDISPGRNIQLIPYAAAARARFLEPGRTPVPDFRTEADARVGLDAKAVIKDAFTVDVTLNPDFSQVESDDPQVTVNQRFEVIYPEKRPFFLENGGYFKTPMQLFFSRRIADPQFGARVTGRQGKWALGALLTDDRAPGERVAPADPLHDSHAVSGVFRLQRDIGRGSSLALMATSQDFGQTHNRVVALDTRLQVLKNWRFVGQAMTSDTRLASGRRLNAPAYFANWLHDGRRFISNTKYTDVAPDFRATLGFVRRTDIRQFEHLTGYRWRPDGRTLQSIGPSFKALVNYDRLGRLQDWQAQAGLVTTLSRVTTISALHEESYELYLGHGFRKRAEMMDFSSDWTRWFGFSTGYSAGRGVNYYPAAGRAPSSGAARNLAASFTLRPNRHARVEPTYLYSTLRASSGERAFHNHILRTKVNYQFNREYSLRFIADYSGVLPNAALVNLEKVKRVGLDALFTWMLNPGTALYIGYTDRYENWLLDPALSPALRRTSFPDLRTGRQVFVKLSYLFRF